MFVVFGTLTAGQVDVVDKRFSVATEFFHIMWFLIAPVGTQVIVDRKVAKRFGLLDNETIETPPAEPPDDINDSDDADQAADEPVEDEVRFPIGMSGKSVLLGYLRGWGFWLGIVLGFLGGMLALMSGDDPEAKRMYPGFLLAAGICLVTAMASYYGPWNRATPRRANQICDAIGMDPGTLPNELRQVAEMDHR